MEPHAALVNVDILHEIFAHLALPCRQETWPILDGDVTEQDWERFDSYAKRIRFLVFYDFGTIHPSVFLRLIQLKKFSPLLPNVQIINSMPGGSGLLSVLSTNLLELCIVPDNQDKVFPTVWACLKALPETSPNLQKLLVQTSLSQASLNAIPRMTNIQNLSLIDPGIHDLSFFYSLSTLEHLESLAISGFKEPTSIVIPLTGTWTDRPFPALRKLEITSVASKIPILLRIFKHSHPLQQLELRQSSRNLSAGSDLSTSWPQVIRDISSKFYSLKSLTMIGPTSNDPSLPLFNVFEPLLDMHQFELVHLDFPCLLFSNADLQKVASAWPGLTTFRMAGSQGTPNATIEALEAFAVGCPKLQGLSLPFDACQLPSTDDHLPISFSKLKTLDAQNSPIDRKLSVARHLDRIFPNLKTIQSTVHESIWSEVGELLKTFKAVRMDQKARDFEVMKRARSSARRISTMEWSS
ncbi:hypothetical protein C0995_003473 [Termitomyces sp. Mi166|nr:hypothetical protein C0995_003473 [Termitomyces sp. Mi166\